jgi:hypothetical protein
MTQRRRFRISLLGSASAALLSASGLALADHAPSFVVPGRLDVPVIVHGIDASWSVVQGDWGLYRPGSRVSVEGGVPLLLAPPPSGYFPFTGRRPRYGRHEVLLRPLRRAPAQSYYRAWSAEPGALSVYPGHPPYDPPPVIPAPRPK